MAKNLRTFLKQLEENDLLLKIDKEVDPDENMGALNWEAVKYQKKALQCNNIKGHPGWKSISGVVGTREIAAVALETSVENTVHTLSKNMRNQEELPKCKMVDSGPVHEVVYSGNEVNLDELPMNVISEIDNGRYLGSGFLVCRDPETGIRNLSILRHQYKGKDKLGIMMVAGRHARKIFEKYKALNKPMPVAIVNGHHAAVVLASTWTTSFDVDEYEIANVLLGETMELVKCKTQDIEVPAEAEVVIEGEIPPDVLEEEGPFGEHSGCTIAGAGLNEIIKVTAITHRKNPIFYQVTEGPSTDGAVLDALPMEVELFNRLKDVGGGPDLKTVVVHEDAGGGHVVIIKMIPSIEGEVRGVLMAALSSGYLHPKIAIAVDDDVDPYDPTEILWSLSTKVNPIEHTFIIDGTRGHSLDSILPQISPKDENPVIRVGSRMGIDATRPPLSQPEYRYELTRIFPQGHGKAALKDFL